MKRVVGLVMVVLIGCGGVSARTVAHRAIACSASGGGVMPDARCTPGATNPTVTQATIHSTICVRGWTATVRPPQSYTRPLKIKQMQAYGYGGQSTSRYELDHLIPLEVGGAPRDVRNLWPEPWTGVAGAHAKDLIENALKARVCAGKETLAQAQHDIATNWTLVH